LREGISVELFDKQNRAGGLLTYGIPGFKLDKGDIERRVGFLKEAGAKFNQNCEVGKDITFEELIDNFDAVFIWEVGGKPGGVERRQDYLTGFPKGLKGWYYSSAYWEGFLDQIGFQERKGFLWGKGGY